MGYYLRRTTDNMFFKMIKNDEITCIHVPPILMLDVDYSYAFVLQQYLKNRFDQLFEIIENIDNELIVINPRFPVTKRIEDISGFIFGKSSGYTFDKFCNFLKIIDTKKYISIVISKDKKPCLLNDLIEIETKLKDFQECGFYFKNEVFENYYGFAYLTDDITNMFFIKLLQSPNTEIFLYDLEKNQRIT